MTSDMLSALTENPLPQSRDFLVHLPPILRTLSLNPRGRTAVCSSGVLQKYVETLVSPEYLPTMRAKRLRDFLSQISYNLSIAASAVGQNNPTNNLTASQMSASLNELMRMHSDIRGIIFNSVFKVLLIYLHSLSSFLPIQPFNIHYLFAWFMYHIEIMSISMVDVFRRSRPVWVDTRLGDYRGR